MIYTVTLNPAVDRELTVPKLALDEVLRASAVRTDPGGKGFNVSRMVKSLGGESVALGFVAGATGQWLQTELTAAGIATDFIEVAGLTRTNLSVRSAESPTTFKVNEPGPTISAEAQAALLDQVRRLCQPDDWWVLAGSLPPGAALDLYAQMIGAIQTNGGRVLLDTSGDGLVSAVAARPFLVKPNQEEALALTLTGVDAISAEIALSVAQQIQALGPQRVLLSLGAEGALLWDGERAWFAQSPAVDAQNPIGAGDALLGGVVWSLSQNQALSEALRWGVACGAAAAEQAGTGVGSRPRVAQLADRVTFRPLT